MSQAIWNIEENRLVWQVQKGFCHTDDIEMSGLYSDYIVAYGVKEDGSLFLEKSCYFPTLRTIPNNTHATYHIRVQENDCPQLVCKGETVNEYPAEFVFDGTLCITSDTDYGFTVHRCLYPSTDSRCCLERVTLYATKDVKLQVAAPHYAVLTYGRGTKGVYVSSVQNR